MATAGHPALTRGYATARKDYIPEQSRAEERSRPQLWPLTCINAGAFTAPFMHWFNAVAPYWAL